ncbi:glycosyltransferase family 2 protein [Halodesulfovibrio sp.]|uniref:glycosyltransferase family 2 protein n=1 Tax=Halodesulfovibrio sp. TaxID=1912772 RepID=UPI0025BC1311|nr:glycosyltransferase family 2 protein [Halodesulfovibrio sp.]
MPTVSIITPVYNSRQFLQQTYATVLNQTYEGWEWILVDDCSSDGSYDFMCANFSDQRVHIYSNKKNSGAGYTRNSAIRHATGRYLAFLDADDLWAETKLERQLEVMQKEDAVISHTSYTFIDERGNDRAGYVKVAHELFLANYMKSTEIGCSSAMIDRKQIANVRFVSSMSREDTLLWISLLRKGYKSIGIDKPLMKYRISSNQTTRPSQLLKMVIQTLNIFFKVQDMSRPRIIFYWTCYMLGAIYKRLRTNVL